MAYVQGLTSDSPVISLGKLGFVDIRDSLREYLQSSDVFTDYDFEGSALSTLVDLLSYNSTFYSFYANMVANESFLDTAIKRSSIASLSKPLSYTPASRRAAKAEIEVQSSSNTVVAYGDAILGGGLNWTPLKSTQLISGVKTKIDIVQGNRMQTAPLQDVVDNAIAHQRFRIPHSEIDTTTLKVKVSEGGNNFNEWRSIDSIEGGVAGITAGDKVYFLTSSFDGGYEIYFGDNIVGKSPVHNSQVSFDYLATAGKQGNFITTFTPQINNVSFTSTTIASNGGSDEESTESIRTHAPSFFQTQGRAVTANDFRSLLRQERGGIDSIIWGGEENDPPQYGRVYVSAIYPNGQLLSEEEKNYIIKFFKSKAVVSIIPEFIDPNIIEVSLSGNVYANLENTSSSEADLQVLVTQFVNTYNERLDGFRDDFNFNYWQSLLRETDGGWAGLDDIVINLVKRFTATEIEPINSVTINYRNKLSLPLGVPGFLRSEGAFGCKDDDPRFEGAARFCILRNGGIGNNGTGDDSIIELWIADSDGNAHEQDGYVKPIGSVDWNTGRIQIDGVEIVTDFAVVGDPSDDFVHNYPNSYLFVVNDGVTVDVSSGS